MNTSALKRDPFMPRPPKGRGPALVLALVAHLLLIAAIAFGVHWRNSEPTTMAAELWSAVPQAAAPRAVEPPPTPPPTAQPEVKKVAPVVKPPEPPTPPKPAPTPQPDPQIAIEKAKQEKVRQEKAERLEADRERAEQQRAKEEQAQKKAAAEKLKADKEKEKEKAEKAEKADAARQEAIRSAQLKRIQGMAGATGAENDTGTALRSSGPSATYAGRVMARIKPNILLTDPVDGNPKAVVDVRLAPDGTIVSRRLAQSSGIKVWDDAVLRAIDRTEVLPRDVDGTVPSQMEIGFRPRD